MDLESIDVASAGIAAIAAVLFGISGLVLGIIGVVQSRSAKQEAATANTISADANKIAGEALEIQKKTAPGPWGALERLGGMNFRVTNTSGRPINVLELNVRPQASTQAVAFRTQRGELVDYGDAIYFSVMPAFEEDPREIEVAWVYGDEQPEEWDYLYRAIPAHQEGSSQTGV